MQGNVFIERSMRIINSRKFPFFFFSYILINILVVALTKPVFSDAQDHASQAYAILNGLWPGIDYMPHSAFLLQYLYYGLFAVFFDMNPYVMRLCSAALIYVLIIYLWLTMIRLKYDTLTRTLAVLSLVIPAYFSMFYIEFIHYSLTCAFLGYAFLSLFYFMRPGITDAKMLLAVFATGFLYGISAATRVHILAMTPFFAAIVMYRYASIAQTGSGMRHFKSLAVLLLGIVAANVPNLFILSRSFNKISYSYTEFLPLLFRVWQIKFENNLPIFFMDMKELAAFLADPGQLFLFLVFVGALLLGISKCIRAVRIKARLDEKVFFPVSCALFSVILLVMYWYFCMFRYYYSHLLFLWACASILLFEYLREKGRAWRGIVLNIVIVGALLGAAAFSGRAAVYALRFNSSDLTIAAFYKTSEMIRRYTGPYDTVLSATSMPVVLSGRKLYRNGGFPRSVFYWHWLKADIPEKAARMYPKTIFSKVQFLRDIESGNIPYVLVDYQLRDVGYTFDLSEVLKNKYRLLDSTNGFDLYTVRNAS